MGRAGHHRWPDQVSGGWCYQIFGTSTSTDAEIPGFELGLGALLKISGGYVNVVPHEVEFIVDISGLLETIHPWIAVTP